MTMLDQIVERKKKEVADLKKRIASDPDHPLSRPIKGKNSHRFLHAFHKEELTVIAEVKRKSPSAGSIGKIEDPILLAKTYEAGGASVISVLTDGEGFGGCIEDLQKVSSECTVPVLRKDFIVDPIQIAEAILAGAEAVLLIVRVLGDRMGEFIKYADEMGIDAFVEINDEEELKIAVAAGAKVIGVNNRDLRTFEVDILKAEKLFSKIPDTCIKVAASGMKTLEDVHRMRKTGYDGVLIGEALVRSEDPKGFIKEMTGGSR